jgi:hypothetical protein
MCTLYRSDRDRDSGITLWRNFNCFSEAVSPVRRILDLEWDVEFMWVKIAVTVVTYSLTVISLSPKLG